MGPMTTAARIEPQQNALSNPRPYHSVWSTAAGEGGSTGDGKGVDFAEQFKRNLWTVVKQRANTVGDTPKVLKIGGDEVFLLTEHPALPLIPKDGVLGCYRVADEHPSAPKFTPLTAEEEAAICRQSLPPAPLNMKAVSLPSVTVDTEVSRLLTGGTLAGGTAQSTSTAILPTLISDLSLGCLFGGLTSDISVMIRTTISFFVISVLDRALKPRFPLAPRVAAQLGGVFCSSMVCQALLSSFFSPQQLVLPPELAQLITLFGVTLFLGQLMGGKRNDR